MFPSCSAPLWENPEALLGRSWITVEHGAPEAQIRRGHCNPAHLLLGSEELFFRETELTLDLIGEVFNFADCGPWRWQRPFFKNLVRRFFREDSNAPAWISVVPRRVPSEFRYPAMAHFREEVKNTQEVVGLNGLARTNINLGFRIGQIETRELLLGYGAISRKDVPVLLQQERERHFHSGKGHESTDLVFYLAHRATDSELISRGQVPAMQPYFDSQFRILTTASIMLAKMTRAGDHHVTQLNVTFRPEDGYTVALAPGRRLLETLLRQYPLEHRLLNQALKR